MGFGDILDLLGGMGHFQRISVAFLAIPLMMLANHNLLQNFTAGLPEHHCQIHVMANDTRQAPNITRNLGVDDLLRISIPMDRNLKADKCHQYVDTQWRLIDPNATVTSNTTMDKEPCTKGWTYDKSVFTRTIISEWDLVCDFRSLRHLAQSIYMAGVLVGSSMFGILSDRYGRKSIIVLSYLIMGVSGACTAFAPNFTAYCILRFLCGMAMSGIVINSVSLCMEWIPTKYRAIVGTINGYSYTTGQFILAGVAYLIRDWRWLQLAVSLPFLVFFLYSWLFVESARWLVISGKEEQAVKCLKKCARINGRKKEGDKLSKEFLKSCMQNELNNTQTKHSVFDLVRRPAMRRISISISLVWFSTSFAYYGLAMDLQHFGYDIYLTQLVFGAVDYPAKLMSVLTITFIGRRFSQASSLILAGLCIFANIFVPQDMPHIRMGFALIGKGSLAASFNSAYIFGGELFPTVIRQSGMGLGGTLARVGSMTAPMVKLLEDVFPSLPLIIYGMAPIISGIATCFLPETRGVPLPDTIEDVEKRATSHLKANREEEQQMKILLDSTKADPDKEERSLSLGKESVKSLGKRDISNNPSR